jgi:hypothetical protein
MNTACKTVVAAAVLSLLSACATTDENARFSPRRTIVQDSDYVAAVEDAATHSPVRVRVVWINPPVERQE